ncbi:MAG: hypothetical protein IPJ52_09485 [Rhodocyclaceae bacterium]|nr:hypothetical protein [Rhodocyclaceae bacterium]
MIATTTKPRSLRAFTTRREAATPHEQLIDELRESTIPKTEREHAAAREIEKNQDRITAAHGVTLESGDVVLSARLLERIYLAMEQAR